jgi:arginine decarboxylase
VVTILPQYAFLTKGVGRHREKIASFEEALRDAGIAKFNIVEVSSIFPPRCKLVSRSRGLALLKPGQVIYCVLSKNSTNENRRLIAASVGLAIPKDTSQYGYLAEHASFGQTERQAGDYAEDMAASMLATILGLDYDSGATWDEKKEIWRISGKIVRTTHITQSAIGCGGNIWTTVVAAAVLVP